jgi:hypothetical protein
MGDIQIPDISIKSIKIMKFNRIQTDVIFVILLLFVSCLYNYYQILFYPPYSLHVWRQADCLSFALNFYKENLNFFKPEINGIGLSSSSKTVSEFPIIYYIVAQLWKIFGQKEFIFRSIDIAIVFFGLFNLFRLTKAILNDRFFSIFIPLFLFTSSVLVYYTNNFLADAPAFGLALSGCYYLHRYITTSKNNALWYALIFILMGAVIKITSLLIFFSLTGALIIELLFNHRFIERKKIISLIIGFAITIGITFCWYLYARYYNSVNSGGFFLQTIYPIWDVNTAQRKVIFAALNSTLIPSFFNKFALAGLMFIFISLFIFYKKVNRFLLFVSSICFVGIILYLILFFKAFDYHDYYLTNLLIFIPLVLITFFHFLNQNYPKIFRHTLFRLSLSLILILLTYQTALKNRLKYSPAKFFASEFFIKQSERELWEWHHWYYNNNQKAFETIQPYLRSIGIVRTDRVLCLADESINISLYFMDQKGYTKYGFSILSEKERVKFAISEGCKYLIINSDQLTNDGEIKEFITNKIGQYQNISIFSLINISENEIDN